MALFKKNLWDRMRPTFKELIQKNRDEYGLLYKEIVEELSALENAKDITLDTIWKIECISEGNMKCSGASIWFWPRIELPKNDII